MIIKLLEDFNIDHRETGNEHCRYGWVQVNCPFCLEGDYKFHMGFYKEENYGFNCYRCGYHSEVKTISKILQINIQQARTIIRRYLKKAIGNTEQIDSEIKASTKNCILPIGHKIKPENRGYRYLKSRFPYHNIRELQNIVKKHKIYYTEYDAELMPNRIIIPTWFNGEIVTYQGRDYTNESRAKYLNAEPENEKMNIKDIVWGYDFCNFDKVLVCEGVFDALMIGDGAVHLGGTAYTEAQVNLLKEFSKVYICFDSEKQASIQASKLADRLSLYSQVFILQTDAEDIGSADIKEIEQLRRLLE